MPISSCDQRPRRGFTMIELVIVIVIVATVAAIAVPRFTQATRRQQLEAAAERVAADLELARTRSRASSQSVSVLFEKAKEQYTVSGGGGDPFTVDIDETPYDAEIVNASFNGENAVRFNGYGLPDSSGWVVLSQSGNEKIKLYLSETGEVTR